MKVGIDGVLLGAWANAENAERILDVGTGTGLIAIMLAQRFESIIEAVDIDSDAVLQANENVNNCPWKHRITVIEQSLQEFSASTTNRYDLIVSNPPYFVNSTKAPDENRNTARHTDSLTHEELIENAIKLLNPDGKICLILPVTEGLQCVDFAKACGLSCHELVYVFPKPHSKPKRVLLRFGFENIETITSKIEIETDIRHQYSVEFSELAKDFYLKL
jgi:tRNA1Val (adenine37-N6)-methyltransferase